jgi:signal transduction histidine kinase
MKLRARLALAAAAVALPLALALAGVDQAEHRRAAEARLIDFVQRTVPVMRDACEVDPASFGGQIQPPSQPPPWPPPPGPPPAGPPPGGPPPRARPAAVYAYDPSFHSDNPRAPPLPASGVAALAGADVASAGPSFFSDEVAVVVRMPWREGPCAIVLATGTTDPSWGAILPESYLWLLPTLAVFAATLAAAGPLVRRIRRLTAAVARSAAHAYADPIDVEGADEVADLARAFDTAGAEVRRRLSERDARERALRQFLANTTHDVMLPLTALQGHLATLREQAAEGRVDARLVVAAMDETHYAASLLSDLVAAARLDGASPRLELAPVDLGALVRRVAGRHATIARELGVALEHAVPGEPLSTLADVTLLEQAVSNVTYNAVHYNRPGGHVAIVLEPSLHDGSAGFCLRVLDDGPGLSDEELTRIAERGFRGQEARSRRPDGQGLGLHIARRAADLHGLALRFARSEHGGLEVTFEGPRCLPA